MITGSHENRDMEAFWKEDDQYVKIMIIDVISF